MRERLYNFACEHERGELKNGALVRRDLAGRLFDE